MAAYEKVAAVVTLYNPDSSVVEHISSYAPYVDRLYIVDNSENIHDVLSHLTQQLPHTVLLHQGANIGMAKALNTALYRAREDGYEWLIKPSIRTPFLMPVTYPCFFQHCFRQTQPILP